MAVEEAGLLLRYVHRVGRTARMGQKGKAILFLLPVEKGYLDLMGAAGVEMHRLDLDKVYAALPDCGTYLVRPSPGYSGFAHMSVGILCTCAHTWSRALKGHSMQAYLP